MDSMQSRSTNQTYNEKLQKLIGIPFQIGCESFQFCDCVGISWLYHKTIHGKDYPHRDGKMLRFRDKKKDLYRIINVIKTWAKQVMWEDLKEGDIVLMKSGHDMGALGVITKHLTVLHMNPVYGSMTVPLYKIKNIFLRGYRPNEKTK